MKEFHSLLLGVPLVSPANAQRSGKASRRARHWSECSRPRQTSVWSSRARLTPVWTGEPRVPSSAPLALDPQRQELLRPRASGLPSGTLEGKGAPGLWNQQSQCTSPLHRGCCLCSVPGCTVPPVVLQLLFCPLNPCPGAERVQKPPRERGQQDGRRKPPGGGRRAAEGEGEKRGVQR